MTEIHPQLAADCHYLGRFPLSHLLLVNDETFPWFILLPDRENIQEIYQLNATDRNALIDESCRLAEFLQQAYSADKLNVAALGNQVPPLHLHHIVRYTSDAAWPGPIWGKVPAKPYPLPSLEAIKGRFETAQLSGLKLESG